MPDPSSLPVLHAVRLLGFADRGAIADRAHITIDVTARILHDAEQRGWVQQAAFAELEGWSLTEAGREENERQLADERQSAGDRGAIEAVYREFLPLNSRLLRACTDWQLKPAAGGRLTDNDHSDPVWDARILNELADLSGALVPLVHRLAEALPRFEGYDARFASALRRAQAGEHGWVDRTNIDSCHRVWFQLHEDLLATLGIDRGEV